MTTTVTVKTGDRPAIVYVDNQQNDPKLIVEPNSEAEFAAHEAQFLSIKELPEGVETIDDYEAHREAQPEPEPEPSAGPDLTVRTASVGKL